MTRPDRVPARRYSWPPFEAGNVAALRHGARSPRRLGELASALAAELTSAAPWTSRPAFHRAVTAWATSEAACELYRVHFDRVGLFDEAGELQAGLDRWDRAEGRASRLRDRLGLDPIAYARLVRLVSDEPAAAEEREALLREARELVAARRRQ